MKKLEVVEIDDDELGKIKVLKIGDEYFDWGLDPESLRQAKANISLHKELSESIILSIIQHFLESFSDFIGKEVSLQEFNKYFEEGCIP